MNKKITAFKGFDKNMTCKNFLYEVGKSYECADRVEVCKSGFHACVNPVDVLAYYNITTSQFAAVTLEGILDFDQNDSKVAASKISIDTMLTLSEFINICVEYLQGSCKKNTNVASDDGSKLAASGNDSKLAASGGGSKLAASGDYSKLVASGGSSRLVASGNDSKLAASGDYNCLAASGDSSKLAASGDYSCLAIAGFNGRVKGGANCAMVLAYWSQQDYRCRMSVAYVGENGIKPDTWYDVDKNGVFVECKI